MHQNAPFSPWSCIDRVVRTVFMAIIVWSVGLLAALPCTTAQLPPGTVLVVDADAGTDASGALFQVNPTSGLRTLLSDFGDAAQGPVGAFPTGVVVEGDGTILIADTDAGTNGAGALFRVDPTTGVRTLLSDFGNTTQGPLGANPFGVAVEAAGSILVADADAQTHRNRGALFRVDPTTGVRILLSDFGNATQCPVGVRPFGLVWWTNSCASRLPRDQEADVMSAGAGHPARVKWSPRDWLTGSRQCCRL